MTSFQPSNILLFGATGQIGRYITDAVLKAQPPFARVSIFTSPATHTKKPELISTLQSRGVKIITGDVASEADVKAAYAADGGVDAVISAVGRDALQLQVDLIRLADESESVKWFFPSEYGTDVEYWPKSADEKPHQLKLKVRRYVRENVKNLKVTFLVTGPYADMFFSFADTRVEAGGFDTRGRRAVLVDEGEGKIGFTTMPDVGKALVAALKHPEASMDKAVKVQSFVATPKQILAEFEKQSGGRKWDVAFSPLQALRDAEQKAWSEDRPDAVLFTLRRIWSEGATLYEKTDNESIGLKDSELETLEESVRRSLTTGW